MDVGLISGGDWKGEAVVPGENFRLGEGWIESKEKVSEYKTATSITRSTAFRRITKVFDVSSFRVTITCNHQYRKSCLQREKFLFVADAENSGVSSSIQLQGIRYRGRHLEKRKKHAVQSTRGTRLDPERT